METTAIHEHSVLIVAPTGEDAAVLRGVLADNGLTPCVCGSIEKLCEEIDGIAGAAIIAEEAFTTINIKRLAQTIQRQPEWSDFPIIIMASAGTNADSAWAVLSDVIQPMNVNVLERPLLTRTLLAAVRSSLRSRDAQYRVAEELRRRKEVEASLTAANEEMQTFSYSISHDLRAPLSTIKGFSTILKEDYNDKLNETGRDYINRIVKSADQMSRLIEDMLNLARISRQEMTIQEVSLSELARVVIKELGEAQPQRQVDVTIHDNLTARCDERLMKIALTNLLGNSWKYFSKMPHPRIEFGNFHQNNETVFFVRDNGAGFPMSQVGELFKPFKRLHSEGEFPGTGIGLPIVYRVISRHGGKIWAEGEPGKGATFYFTLRDWR